MVAACATFTPGTPFAWIVAILLIGGFFRSLQYTSLNTIAYADIDSRYMSRATSLVAVAQQLSLSFGVALGASLVELTHGSAARTRSRPPTSSRPGSSSALISAMTFFLFWRLPLDAGAEVARRPTAATRGRPTRATRSRARDLESDFYGRRFNAAFEVLRTRSGLVVRTLSRSSSRLRSPLQRDTSNNTRKSDHRTPTA